MPDAGGKSARCSYEAECPLLAQSRHPDTLNECPLLGVKRTSRGQALMSAFDPKRTFFVLMDTPSPPAVNCEH